MRTSTGPVGIAALHGAFGLALAAAACGGGGGAGDDVGDEIDGGAGDRDPFAETTVLADDVGDVLGLIEMYDAVAIYDQPFWTRQGDPYLWSVMPNGEIVSMGDAGTLGDQATGRLTQSPPNVFWTVDRSGGAGIGTVAEASTVFDNPLGLDFHDQLDVTSLALAQSAVYVRRADGVAEHRVLQASDWTIDAAVPRFDAAHGEVAFTGCLLRTDLATGATIADTDLPGTPLAQASSDWGYYCLTRDDDGAGLTLYRWDHDSGSIDETWTIALDDEVERAVLAVSYGEAVVGLSGPAGARLIRIARFEAPETLSYTSPSFEILALAPGESTFQLYGALRRLDVTPPVTQIVSFGAR